MKRTMRTNNIKFMAAALCVAISFISCQNDNYADNSNLIYLFPEFQSAQAIQTRGVASGDYSSYTPQSGDKIQAFTYYDEDKESPMYGIRTGAFTYMDGEWKSTVGCEKEASLDIYSFMPADIASASMAENGKLTLGSLKIISAKDVMYSVAAAKTKEELAAGVFHLEKIHLPVSETDKEDKVWFAMDHMFAMGTLNFKASSQYLKIRDIEITEVKVSAAKGYSAATVTYGNPTTVNFSSAACSGSSLDVDIDLPDPDATTGKVLLTEEGQDYGSFYFLPKAGLPLELTVTYNVYTKANASGDAVLTRENQKAVNSKLITIDNLKAGQSHKITVTVKPTYLLVMADEDGELELPIE